jgi:hypothetical protein
VIAVAAGCGAIATIRGAVDRFHSSISWRSGGWLLLSITIAIGSIVSTAGWALIAGGVIVLGKGDRTLLIALGTVSAFVVKTRRLLRFRSTALRVAYTTSVGLNRPHPNSIIFAPGTRDEVNAKRAFRDTVWNAFHDGSDRAAPFANLHPSAADTSPALRLLHSQIARLMIPVYLWASPIKTSKDVVGVVALQTSAAYSWRTTRDESFLTAELRSCAEALADAMKADYG